jgi:hypothetical protein
MGKSRGRVSVPKGRVCLPEILFAFGILDAHHFSSMSRDLNGELVILDLSHIVVADISSLQTYIKKTIY